MCDLLWRDFGESLRHLLAGYADPGVDHDEAVVSVHHGDVAAGAFEDGNAVPEFMG
ncbi:hypothetical protein D3C71_2252080 [compost metagenome]